MRKSIDIHATNPEAQPEQFAGLSPMERSVWMLATQEGFGETEISEITGLSVPAAQQVLKTAQQKLQTKAVLPIRQTFSRRLLLRSAAAVFIGLLCYVGFKQNVAEKPGMERVASQLSSIPEKTMQAPMTAETRPNVLSNTPFLKTEKKASNARKTSLHPIESNTSNDLTQAPAPANILSNSMEDNMTTVQVPPALRHLSSPIQQPVSMSASKPLKHPMTMDLYAHPLAQTSESKMYKRLREALMPRSFAGPDERISISLQLPSIFLPEQN